MTKLASRFTRAEMACRCGCGAAEMAPELVSMLQAVRERLGRAVVVTSGRRCPAHNDAVGGKQGSEHLTGHGVDVRTLSGRERYEVVAAALTVGFTRIGVAREFVHLGVSPTHPAGVVWVY